MRGRYRMKARPFPLALISVVVFAGLLGACSPDRTSPTSPPIPRVGLMHVGTDHVPPSLDTLVARLVELGWIDGPQDELMAKLTDSGRARSPRIELLWRNLEPGEAERQAARIRSRPRGRHRCVRGQIHRRCSGRNVGDPGSDPGGLPPPVRSGSVRPRGEPGTPGREPDGGFRCQGSGRQAARALPADHAGSEEAADTRRSRRPEHATPPGAGSGRRGEARARAGHS